MKKYLILIILLLIPVLGFCEFFEETKKKAIAGEAIAQYMLGIVYQNAQGIPQDYKEATKWYRKAAEQGYAAAQLNLGEMYYKGEGVLQDYVTAHAWLNLAGSNGNKQGITNRDIVSQKMTHEQIAEAQAMAKTLLKKLQ